MPPQAALPAAQSLPPTGAPLARNAWQRRRDALAEPQVHARATLCVATLAAPAHGDLGHGAIATPAWVAEPRLA